MTSSSLLLGILFGPIGLGLFVYGRKQRAVAPLLCGLALMVVPYFIANAWVLFFVGAVLVAIPYFVKVFL